MRCRPGIQVTLLLCFSHGRICGLSRSNPRIVVQDFVEVMNSAGGEVPPTTQVVGEMKNFDGKIFDGSTGLITMHNADSSSTQDRGKIRGDIPQRDDTAMGRRVYSHMEDLEVIMNDLKSLFDEVKELPQDEREGEGIQNTLSVIKQLQTVHEETMNYIEFDEEIFVFYEDERIKSIQGTHEKGLMQFEEDISNLLSMLYHPKPKFVEYFHIYAYQDDLIVGTLKYLLGCKDIPAQISIKLDRELRSPKFFQWIAQEFHNLIFEQGTKFSNPYHHIFAEPNFIENNFYLPNLASFYQVLSEAERDIVFFYNLKVSLNKKIQNIQKFRDKKPHKISTISMILLNNLENIENFLISSFENNTSDFNLAKLPSRLKLRILALQRKLINPILEEGVKASEAQHGIFVAILMIDLIKKNFNPEFDGMSSEERDQFNKNLSIFKQGFSFIFWGFKFMDYQHFVLMKKNTRFEVKRWVLEEKSLNDYVEMIHHFSNVKAIENEVKNDSQLKTRFEENFFYKNYNPSQWFKLYDLVNNAYKELNDSNMIQTPLVETRVRKRDKFKKILKAVIGVE